MTAYVQLTLILCAALILLIASILGKRWFDSRLREIFLKSRWWLALIVAGATAEFWALCWVVWRVATR